MVSLHRGFPLLFNPSEGEGGGDTLFDGIRNQGMLGFILYQNPFLFVKEKDLKPYRRFGKMGLRLMMLKTSL